ncbi:MAG: hypothetical protein JWM68_728 [Verrucomicrobiales bacterium]|nr:hypothetical protein [Verrucomicrobiales bacterium]
MKTETIAKSSEPVSLTCSRPGKLAYLILLLGVVGSAVTGIGSLIAGKVPMSAWILMIHVGSGPVFALGLALFAVTWADRSRLCEEASTHSCANKFLFWLLLISGLLVILTGVVPMTPIFGTPGQHTLYLTHRYGTIVFTALFVLHALTLRRAKK